MVSDLSDLVSLESYCNECWDEYVQKKDYSTAKKFRYIEEQLEEIIERETLEEPLSKEHIPDD